MTTKSEAWKYDHALTLLGQKDSEALEVMKYIFEGCKGFVKIMSPNNRKGWFYSAENLCDPEKLPSILTAEKFEVSNLMFSMSTYKRMGKATQDQILEVCALGIDVDYRSVSGQEEIEPEEVMRELQILFFEGYPEPSYIEYGRCLRLVYVLDKPYHIVKDQTKNRRSKNFLKRIMQVLCEKLNKEKNFKYNAEPHKLTSFFRVPGSLNRKYIMRWNTLKDEIEVEKVELYEVKTTEKLHKWDVNKLAEQVLPDVPEWLESWQEKQAKRAKQKKKKGAEKVVRIYSGEFFTKRLQELEELQARGYDKYYRERLCYLYWLTCLQSEMDPDEAEEAVKKFNKGFKKPLRKNELRQAEPKSSFIDERTGCRREGWERKFTDKGIRAFLEIGDREPDILRGEGMTTIERSKAYRERKKAEKALNGETKQAQLAMRREAVEAYRASGKSWQEIADILGVGLRTAKRYGEHMREA